MNPNRAKELWNRIADRDGVKCYRCSGPWYMGMSMNEIYTFAEQNGFIFPFNDDTDPLPLMLESKLLARKKLVIEDMDNRGDHSEANFQRLGLAHQSCNLRKDGVGKWDKRPSLLTSKQMKKFLEGARERARVRGNKFAVESPQPSTAEMRRNLVAEPKFREAVIRILTREGAVEVNELIDAACQDSGVSQTTGRRYYAKLSAKYAETAILEEYSEDGPDGLIVMVRLKETGGQREKETGRQEDEEGIRP